MFESLFESLCKIGTFFKISANKSHSPSSAAKASAKCGVAAAISGDNSPVYIGGSHTHSTAQPKNKADSLLKFKNNLTLVVHELHHNFRYRGNAKNPFITTVLEKLVYNEPTIHNYPELFQKAINCLNIAKKLSSASPHNRKLRPADGQHLMKGLAKYISHNFGIDGPSQI